jgi:transcriptional regulator with XRE-family HTH domain
MTQSFDKSAATLAYVRFLLDELNVSPSALAKAAGIASSTLTRPLNNANYKFSLSTSTIEKIAAVTGVNPAPFFDSPDLASLRFVPYLAKDLYDDRWGEVANFQKEDSENNGDLTIAIGKVALGVWTEVGSSIGNLGNAFLSLQHSFYASSDCFYVVVADNSSRALADAGELLFCVRYDARKRQLEERFPNGKMPEIVMPHNREMISPVWPEQFVILERHRDGGRLVELSVRQALYNEDERAWELWPAIRRAPNSSAIVFRTTLEDPDADGKIIGIVEHVIRSPNHRGGNFLQILEDNDRRHEADRRARRRKDPLPWPIASDGEEA